MVIPRAGVGGNPSALLGQEQEPKMTCKIDTCSGPARSRGWCKKHYTRWIRTGSPLAKRPVPTTPAGERFWAKVQKTDSCWEWKGYVAAEGYGRFYVHPTGATWAHRFAFEAALGPIPKGLQIDHLCYNRSCVNPDHLEAVTQQENLRRSRRWETERP